eukprot:COSAG02_NODE_875_length_16279_cov_199.143078_11_plen_233_part_00
MIAAAIARRLGRAGPFSHRYRARARAKVRTTKSRERGDFLQHIECIFDQQDLVFMYDFLSGLRLRSGMVCASGCARPSLDPDSGQKSRIRVRVEMAISTRHTTSHTNRKTGVRKFHREIICKRRKTIDLVIFGNSIEIGMVLISDNSGASGSSGIREAPCSLCRCCSCNDRLSLALSQVPGPHHTITPACGATINKHLRRDEPDAPCGPKSEAGKAWAVEKHGWNYRERVGC